MAQNRNVLEQNERADRQYEEAYGKTAPVVAPVAPVADPLSVVPVVEPPPAVVQPTVENWEQKFRVLQGKFNAEVPVMAAKLRELTDKLRDSDARIATLAATPAPELDLNAMTPESVVEKFGEDFAAAVGAVAARVSEASSKKLRDEFIPRVEAVVQSTAKTVRSDFMRELGTLVPDWRAIDTNEDFTAFLDEPEGLSGRARRDYFNEADSANNAPRLAKFFDAFKGQQAPAPVVTAVLGDSRMSLENQLAPSVVHISTPVAGAKYWTKEDIRKFYSDARRNLYSPAEYKRIETDIFAAAAQGRMAA